MPSPYLKDLSKKTGKNIAELEKYWPQAKKLTSDQFGVPESSFEEKHLNYAIEVLKNLVGIKEKRISVQDFINSEKSADEFIAESISVTSGDFPSLQTNVISKDDDNDEDDEEDEFVKKVRKTPDGTGPHGRGMGPGKGKADGSGLVKEDSENTPQEVKEETELYVDAPKRMEIMQQWVEEGDKLLINNAYKDIDSRFKVEVRIPHTNKTAWVIFVSKKEAIKYGFYPQNEAE